MDDRKTTSDEFSEQATTIGDYKLISEIGKGAQSTVWKVERRSNGQEVALKQVYLSKLNRQLKKCLDCELHFLSSVDHPHIIRLLDVFQVDMWSVGAILFELLYGFPPFSGRNNVQLILPGLDCDCVDMCSRLLSTNPVQRLSFHEFYHHKFLKRKVVL